MVVGIDAARDAETYEIVATEAVLAGHGVTVGEDVTDLAGAYAGFEVKLAGERLGRELLFGNLGEHLVGIHEDGMTTGGTLVGDTVLVEFLGEVVDLLDTGLHHVEFDVLFQSDSQCVHVAAVHTTIGEESFEGNAEEFGAFVPLLLVGGDETAHIHETVFLGAHGHRVGIAEHLFADLAKGLVLISFLAGLDEIGVLDKTGTVDVHGYAVFVAELTGLADVLHRHGLSSHGVVGHRQHHKRHFALVLVQHLLQLLEAHIAFERYFELGVIGLGDGDIDGKSLAALDVALGGVEVGVAGDNHTRLHQIAEQHILCSTALVGGDYIFKAGEFGDGVLHVVEGAGSAVALVAHHHGAPLAVAHGACATVGEQVDIDIVALQHEDVVVGFKEPLLALFAGRFLNGFDHLDFPSFCKR